MNKSIQNVTKHGFNHNSCIAQYPTIQSDMISGTYLQKRWFVKALHGVLFGQLSSLSQT